MIRAQRREKIDLKRWKKIRKMSLQIFLKLTYMLLRHLNYMMLHFGKTCTNSFWEISSKSELGFCKLIVHVMNAYIKNLYLCWVVLKNINGMNWRCPIFEQHRWFISWYINELHGQFTGDGKNRYLAQASSTPTEKSEQQINHNTNWRNPRKEESDWSLCSLWAKIWPFRNNWYFSKSPNI